MNHLNPKIQSVTVPSVAESAAAPGMYTFGEFTVDVGAARLLQGSSVIALPSRIFDVLVYLIRHRERSVKKDEIISAIWDNVIVTDDSLIHAISVLRRTLGDGPNQHKYIETIPRRGYRFVGSVQIIDRASDQTPAKLQSTDSTPEIIPVAAVAPEIKSVELPVSPVVSDQPVARQLYGNFWRSTKGLALAGLLVLLTAFVVFQVNQRLDEANVSETSASLRLFQPPPPGMSIVSGGVLSPDGRYLAFIARDDMSGQTGLWVRALQAREPQLLQGTEGATKPFWSPDSSYIGFFANGKLFTTDLNSEQQIIQLASVVGAAGATWSTNDTILFADWSTGIFSVPASGKGEVETVMLLDRNAQDIALSWPQFFPDNRRFLYLIASLDPTREGAWVGNLDTQQSFKLIDTTSSVTLAPPHHLLYIQKDLLIAEELDPERLELTGHAVVIARGISEPSLAVENFVSASANLLAFKHGIKEQNLVWFSRTGENLDALAIPTVLYNPRLSPDGERLLASSSVTSNPGLWLTRLDREEFTRIERDAIAPIWSKDGQRIAYTSRDGVHMLVQSVDSLEAPIHVMSDPMVKILGDWSADGRHLVYTRQAEATGLDVWMVDIGTGEAQPLLATTFSETQARLSPDGKWIAYTSDESGRLETWIARFPGMENKQMISVDGGGQPQWRSDQGELFYLSPDQALMSVTVTDTAAMTLEPPQLLFRTPITGNPGGARDYYAVDASGTRFLIDAAVPGSTDQEITILVNWASRLNEDKADSAQSLQQR